VSANVLPPLAVNSKSEQKVNSLPPLGFEPEIFGMLALLSDHSAKFHPDKKKKNTDIINITITTRGVISVFTKTRECSVEKNMRICVCVGGGEARKLKRV
jgi:hypothetical protein